MKTEIEIVKENVKLDKEDECCDCDVCCIYGQGACEDDDPEFDESEI